MQVTERHPFAGILEGTVRNAQLAAGFARSDPAEVAGHAVEETGHRPKLLLRPVAVGIVMALRALQLHAHEQRADRARGAVHRRVRVLADKPVIDQLRLILDLALTRENVAHDRIPLGVFIEPLGKPRAEIARLLHRLAAAVHVRRQFRRANPFAPSTPEVVAKLRRRQQRINQLRPLVRRLVIQKRRRLFRRGHAPVEVQIHAPQKLRIRRHRRRLQLAILQPIAHMLIHRRRHHLRLMPFALRQQWLLKLLERWRIRRQPRRDPRLERRLVLCRERRFFLGHVVLGNGQPQLAFLRFTGHHRRPCFAALEHQRQRTQIQLALLNQTAMAAHAVFLKNRQNIMLQQRRRAHELAHQYPKPQHVPSAKHDTIMDGPTIGSIQLYDKSRRPSIGMKVATLWMRGGELLVQQLGILFDHLAGELFGFGDLVGGHILFKIFRFEFWGKFIPIGCSDVGPRISGHIILQHSKT